MSRKRYSTVDAVKNLKQQEREHKVGKRIHGGTYNSVSELREALSSDAVKRADAQQQTIRRLHRELREKEDTIKRLTEEKAEQAYKEYVESRHRFQFKFIWYDMWIGAFWDRKGRILYIAPLPCCVFIIKA